MNIRSEMIGAIRKTRKARISAGLSRDSNSADIAYANAAAGVLLRKIAGFEVTIDGEKLILPPEDVQIIMPSN